MRLGQAIVYLFTFAGLCFAQVQPGELKPGESWRRELSLKALHTQSLTIVKQGGTMRLQVLAAGKPIREVTSNGLSVAPMKLLLLAGEACDFQLELSNLEKTGKALTFQLTLAPPAPASVETEAEWDAEAVLFTPTGNKGQAKSSFEETVSQLRRASAQFEKVGDAYKQILALRNLAGMYTQKQDFAAAREEYAQAAAILKDTQWRFEDSVVRQNLAYTLQSLGKNRAAIAELNQVLAIRAELKDDYGRGITWFGRGQAYWHVGEFQLALDDYRLSLAIFRKLGEPRWEATLLNALGLLNAELGRVDTGRANYADASAVWRRLNDQNGLSMTISNLGLLKETLGQHEESRAAFLEAIKLSEVSGNRQVHAYVLQNLGDVAANQGNHETALQFYQESLSLKRQLNDRQAGAETERKMGLSYLALGRRSEAGSLLESALAESREVSDRKGEAQSLGALARFEAAQGNPQAAEERIGQAVRLIESTRMELRTRDLRTSYFSGQSDFYDFAIDLAMAKGGSGAARALEWSERERARTLLDSIGKDDADPDDPFASIAGVDDIRRDLLDADTTLVEYSTGPERTHAWVISAAGVRAVRLPGLNGIRPVVDRLKKALEATPRDGLKLDKALEETARLIWWPLGISKARRVVIAPAGGLENVPFAALPVSAGGKRLIEQCEIASVPSASLAAAIRRNRVSYPRRIAIFADPVFSAGDLRNVRGRREDGDPEELARLRFSREEAKAITRRAGAASASEWLDFNANLDNLRRASAEPGAVLHLATHAIVDERDPGASRLVLSRLDSVGQPAAGALRLNDIYNIRIRRQLVVLSACRTAAGPQVKGEGVLSLTRAFLYAGARGVVASSWKVEDRASAELMQRFYDHLLVRGGTPAAALRSAQLSMMKDPRWNAVDNWAAFVYVGDWRIMPWGTASEP